MPAFASLSHASLACGVTSRGWLKCVLRKDRVVLLEHVAEVVGDPARQHAREPGADADDLNVRDRPQAGDDVLQLLVADHQRIPTRQEHVADLRVRPDVVESHRDRLVGHVAGAADHALAGAEPAIHRAAVGDEQQNAVGIAVRKARDGAVLVLVEGILERFLILQLVDRGDRLFPDRVPLGLDEVVVVARDPHRIHLAHLVYVVDVGVEILVDGLALGDAVSQIEHPLFHVQSSSLTGKVF